jgi:mevalonate kinase
MPAIAATAPGKIILFGEHAVVYGQPAIAIPVLQVHAKVIISANPLAPEGEVHIQSPAIELDTTLADLPQTHPLKIVILGVLERLNLSRSPACTIRITSTIPVAAGLGSGAAISVALIRAFSTFLGKPFANEMVNDLAYEIEKIYHGTPSGIDNTVITYAQPVYFVRNQPIKMIKTGKPLTFLIADTGVSARTATTVAKVRVGWENNPQQFGIIFEAIGDLVRQAREAIQTGQLTVLGELMNKNQMHLEALGVSSPELEKLITAARQAGAIGAKLSGGGGGGNMIVLVTTQQNNFVKDALLQAGATNILESVIAVSPNSN